MATARRTAIVSVTVNAAPYTEYPIEGRYHLRPHEWNMGAMIVRVRVALIGCGIVMASIITYEHFDLLAPVRSSEMVVGGNDRNVGQVRFAYPVTRWRGGRD